MFRICLSSPFGNCLTLQGLETTSSFDIMTSPFLNLYSNRTHPYVCLELLWMKERLTMVNVQCQITIHHRVEIEINRIDCIDLLIATTLLLTTLIQYSRHYMHMNSIISRVLVWPW